MTWKRATTLLAGKLMLLSVSAVLLLNAQTQAWQDNPNTADAKQEGDPGDNTLREKTIYIPFEKLREVFEKDQRKVVLSYEEFERLWKAAREKSAEKKLPAEKRQPIITQADSRAEILEDVVTVVSKLKVELLTKGWTEVPLGLRGAAIQSSRVGDKEARVIFDPKTGYRLLVNNETAEPKVIDVELTYARAYQKTPGQSSVTFEAPRAAVNRWRVRIGQPKVKIDIEPLIAVTRANPGKNAGNGSDVAEKIDLQKETVVYAFLGVAPQVTLRWNPKSEGASGLDAVVSAQTVQQIVIEKNVQRTQVQIDYEISRAELSGLQIEVPGDVKVTSVFNENIRKWNVEKKDDRQLVRIDLFSPIKGAHRFSLELEKLTEEALKQDYTSPLVSAVDAARQQGIVVFRLADGLKPVLKNRLGLLQLDKSELPGQLARGAWQLAFRYASLPYRVDLNIEKILPRIVGNQLTEISLTPQKLLSSTQLVMKVQQAGIFSTNLKIPTGYSVRSITGSAPRKGVAAVPVSEFRQDESDPTLWHVDFSRKALGEIGLLIELEKDLADPNLLTPTGNASTFPLPFTLPSDSNLEYSEGSLIVYGPESLRINPDGESGLQQIPINKAHEKIPLRGAKSGAGRAVLSYSFSGDQPALSVNVIRRKPQVTVRQLLTAKIENGVVKYDARFMYEILYSGVKNLRIDLPKSVAADIRNVTQGLVEFEDDSAEGLEGDHVAWTFSGESELFGNQTVHLTWESEIDELDIGTSVNLELPRLIPRNVDRSEGQIVLSKAETIDIQPGEGVEGLIPIDPKVDLMPEAKVSDAAAAFEFVKDWKLPIRATRYDVEDVKLTNVEAGLVQVVRLRQSGLSVQALFRVRSAVQRLGMKLPPGVKPSEAFDSQPVRINGQPVNLEIGNEDELFIPLTDIQPDEPFLLDLRYKVPADAARIVLPTFSDDPAMQKVFLCVYIPSELAVVGSSGPWTNELLKDKSPWQILTEGNFNEYYVEQSIRRRVEQIRGDILAGVANLSAAPPFKVDGRSYLFSALRPEPEQELRVTAIPRWWVHALIIFTVVVLGLPLYRRSVTLQLSVLFLILALVIFSGVFLPMLARQVVGSVLLISLGLLVMIWLIGHATTIMVQIKKVWDSVTQPDPVSFEPAVQGAGSANVVRSSGSSAHGTAPPNDAPPPNDSSSTAPEESSDENNQENREGDQ